MKILIIDKVSDILPDRLVADGHVVDYLHSIKPEEVPQALLTAEGLVLRSKMKITKQVLENAPKLRFVARAGAGLDEIDETFLKERGIKLIAAPEGNRDAVGEHALGMLVSLMNKMAFSDRAVRGKKWDREGGRGYEILGKTVGIVGYGNMGKAFAKRLSGFGCRVLAYDKYKNAYGDDCAEESSMEKIFEEADIISLHIPLTPETKGLANSAFFSSFKKERVWFVNTARGEVAPMADILSALDSGKLAGAALDVLENEILVSLSPSQEQVFSRLSERPDVLFTPHVGGWTYESYDRISEVLHEKIIGLFGKAV